MLTKAEKMLIADVRRIEEREIQRENKKADVEFLEGYRLAEKEREERRK